MNIIKNEEFIETDINIFDIIARRQTWQELQTFSYSKPRTKNGFLYLNSCDCTIKQENKNNTEARCGQLIYLPKGSIYDISFKNCHPKKIHTYISSFDIADNSGNEIIFSKQIEIFDVPIDAADIMNKLSVVYEQLRPNPLKMKIYIYSIIDLITEQRNTSFSSRDYQILRSGFEYIKNSADENPCIDTAAKKSGVSPAYFRRIFKKYYKVSPKEYVMNIKIEKAKEMLRSNLYTISEVSDALNFSTPSYFTMIFKKKTGLTPSAYITYDTPHLH